MDEFLKRRPAGWDESDMLEYCLYYTAYSHAIWPPVDDVGELEELCTDDVRERDDQRAPRTLH
jgi:hypothetical protein